MYFNMYMSLVLSTLIYDNNRLTNIIMNEQIKIILKEGYFKQIFVFLWSKFEIFFLSWFNAFLDKEQTKQKHKCNLDHDKILKSGL